MTTSVLPSMRWALMVLAASFMMLQSHGEGGIRLPDQPPQEPSGSGVSHTDVQGRNGERQGKGLLDLFGLGTGPDKDPYLARTNQECLNGDLAECFKSQALGVFDEFFQKDSYLLSDSVRIVRMPETQLRSLSSEPFEFSSSPRAEDSEWDALVKFASRKIERFLKSFAFEINIEPEVTEEGRYSPRFINEIAEEIDVIEDKKAPLFKRNRLKKFFIPMLLILKLFKLKLLLFLPLILGLASFKKLLAFFALIVPGIIGYFHLCKPNLHNSGFGGHTNYYSNGPQYSPAGLGIHSYGQNAYDQYPSHGGHGQFYGRGQSSGGVAFKDDSFTSSQDLAYQGWEYRNSKNLKAEPESN